MQKKIYIIFIWLLLGLNATAQSQLPPSWSDTASKGAQYSTLTTAYLSPTRILWSQTPEGGTIENPTTLLKTGNGQPELFDGDICTVSNGQYGESSILLDFGRELQGGLQIVTGRSKSKHIKVRLTFGESASEAMSKIDGLNGATNDHAVRELTLELPWLGVAEIGNSGFRFVRVDLIGDNASVKFKEIRAIFKYRDIPYRGSFECDNQRLNDIWMTGAYTVHLNMQEYLWDGIKRDRLVWVGDLHPEVMTINSVFGYNEVVPKSLNIIRDATPLPGWMNGFSSYSIWWLLIQKEWYMYHGDKAYLDEQKEYITGLLNQLITHIDNQGSETLDGRRFLDWPSSTNREAIHAGLQALMVMAMDAGEFLMQEFGDTENSAKCRDAAKRLRANIPPHSNSKQAAALMSIAGVADPKAANSEVLSVGGADNFSTFYGYYMLQAMAKAGAHNQAMDIISQYWGGMLDLGATTFWEDFDMDWLDNGGRIDELVPADKIDVHASYGNFCYKKLRHSLCHGWASGPTAWITENVLGVKVVKPGCSEILIEPHLGDLNWVKGRFPTPKGEIQIEHKKEKSGKIKTTVKAPKGIKVKVVK